MSEGGNIRFICSRKKVNGFSAFSERSPKRAGESKRLRRYLCLSQLNWHSHAFALFNRHLFNFAEVLLGFLIVGDTHKDNLSTVTLEGIRIVLCLDLVNGGLHVLIPF